MLINIYCSSTLHVFQARFKFLSKLYFCIFRLIKKVFVFLLGVSFHFFSGNLFSHFSLTMLQLSVLTPGCIHPPGIYFSCLNIFSIFLDFLPSLSQHFLNSPRNFTMTIFTFFTCTNDCLDMHQCLLRTCFSIK